MVKIIILNGNLRERTTDCGLDKVGGGDDHLGDEHQPKNRNGN